MGQHHVQKTQAHCQLPVRVVEQGLVPWQQRGRAGGTVHRHARARPHQKQHHGLHPFQHRGPLGDVDLREWSGEGRARQHTHTTRPSRQNMCIRCSCRKHGEARQKREVASTLSQYFTPLAVRVAKSPRWHRPCGKRACTHTPCTHPSIQPRTHAPGCHWPSRKRQRYGSRRAPMRRRWAPRPQHPPRGPPAGTRLPRPGSRTPASQQSPRATRAGVTAEPVQLIQGNKPHQHQECSVPCACMTGSGWVAGPYTRDGGGRRGRGAVRIGNACTPGAHSRQRPRTQSRQSKRSAVPTQMHPHAHKHAKHTQVQWFPLLAHKRRRQDVTMAGLGGTNKAWMGLAFVWGAAAGNDSPAVRLK